MPIDGVISEAGVCPVHRIEKMFIGTDNSLGARCVKCDADAQPKTGRIQTVEDPGEDYFKGAKSTAKVEYTEKVPAIKGTTTPGAKQTLPGRPNTGVSFDSCITNALEWLKAVPMPKDLKQFKSLQKAIKTLEGLSENPNE